MDPHRDNADRPRLRGRPLQLSAADTCCPGQPAAPIAVRGRHGAGDRDRRRGGRHDPARPSALPGGPRRDRAWRLPLRPRRAGRPEPALRARRREPRCVHRSEQPFGLTPEEAMKYVMLIYQGTALERQAALPDEEQKQIYADYQGINKTPGVTPGLPVGLPERATTVRVEGGKTLTTDGPFVGMKEAVGGWFILEADDLDAAIEVAGGASCTRSPITRPCRLAWTATAWCSTSASTP